MKMKIVIIGAGAAGCFCAIEVARMLPEAEVHVMESKPKALAKVAVTGGGRCNLTNTFANVANLKDVYPRGDKLMRRALARFSHEDAWAWFEREGVRLVAQEDECVFPQSQDAMEIVDTLLRGMRRAGVRVHYNNKVVKVEKPDGRFVVTNQVGTTMVCDRVVVTTGGHPTMRGFEMLSSLGVNVVAPVPSLFTLNVKGDWHQQLMGTVVEDVSVGICGTKLCGAGPLLLTHWGMSGPAVLKLSSHAARWLAENDYRCRIAVNWFGGDNEESVRPVIARLAADNAQKLVGSAYPRQFVSRHWDVLLQRAGIPASQRWGALNKKQLNRLTVVLTADVYEVAGKYPHKEEFVTCGGVSLKDIDINTMQSKRVAGLYFAGEVLDIDAVTGGFNLQAAWSTGYAVAQSLGGQ